MRTGPGQSALRACVKRHFIHFAAIAGIMMMSVASADAASCSSLKAEYASLSRGGNSGEYKKYADAYSRQQSEISKLEGRMRRSDCGNRNSSACRNFESTLKKMRSNLSALKARRDANSGRKASSATLDRLQAQINEACRTVKTTNVSVKKETGRPLIDSRSAPPAENTKFAPQSVYGTGHRTLCVRTCDGYYFPISFSTGQGGFKRDAAICQAMCPQAETELFSHRVEDQESEDMVSTEGTPYAAMTYAFRYRTTGKSKNCTCGKPDASALKILGVEQTIAQTNEAETAKPVEPQAYLPIPAAHPDIWGDPVSQSMAAAGNTPEKLIAMTQAVTVGQVHELADAAEEIRVVGPQFLPAQEEAIDLRSPAPTIFQ